MVGSGGWARWIVEEDGRGMGGGLWVRKVLIAVTGQCSRIVNGRMRGVGYVDTSTMLSRTFERVWVRRTRTTGLGD